ncbi:sulfatase [Pontibacter sp. E15-1]|uniref:sulfatase family protein n=1 Tax=Pontibacter sp. E15-1 TaxID=2919918 RepID=UPI001F5014F4|nr:sulfatase [Pontibacter sp. E15-1]MCJ8165710.1 sulfatase [Pontibacter sp. E15-1]
MTKHFILLMAGLVWGLTALAQQQGKQPNIVIIISDDHAFQAISAYGGNLMQTPNIDRIAKGGAVLNRGYVTNSICGPSRAVILTGKYSHKNGFKDNENSSFDGSQNTFIKELRKGGYQTAWIGKWHLETEPQGFDYWQVLPGQGQYYNPDFQMMDGTQKTVAGYVTNVTEDLAEQWLDRRNTDKPFCLVIGQKATHRVWLPDTADFGMFDKKTFPVPDTYYDSYAGRKAAQVQEMSVAEDMIMGYDLKMYPDYDSIREGSVRRMSPTQKAQFDAYYKPIYQDLKSRNLTGRELAEWKYQRYMRDYLSTAASLDRNIGRTLDYLEQHGLAENTLVVYMSDQGFFLGEHGWFDKRFMYEESFRTPLLVRYPGVIKPGTKSDHFVMNLDIAPTMLDAAGVAIPRDMQGASMLPVLTDKNAKGRDALYYHYYENGEHAVSPHFGIKTDRYKLIRFYKRVESWELYDLQKDPRELHNLYGRKGYEKITARLRKQLEGLVDKYDDQGAHELMEKKIADNASL